MIFAPFLLFAIFFCKPRQNTSELANLGKDFKKLNVDDATLSGIRWSTEQTEALSLMRKISTETGAEEALLIGKVQGEFTSTNPFDPRWSSLHGFVPPPNVPEYLELLKNTHQNLGDLDRNAWVFAGCAPKDLAGVLDFKDHDFWMNYPRQASSEDLKKCGELIEKPPKGISQLEFVVVPWRTKDNKIVLRQLMSLSKDVFHNPGIYLGPFVQESALTILRPDSWKPDIITQLACASANPVKVCPEGWAENMPVLAENLSIKQNPINFADLSLKWYQLQRSKTYNYLAVKALPIFASIVSIKQFKKGVSMIRMARKNSFTVFEDFKKTAVTQLDGVDIPPVIPDKFRNKVQGSARKVALAFGFLNIAGASIALSASAAEIAGVERTLQLMHPDDSQLLAFSYSMLMNLSFFWGFWDILFNNPRMMKMVLKGFLDLKILSFLGGEVLSELANSRKIAELVYKEILAEVASSSQVSAHLARTGGAQVVAETAQAASNIVTGKLSPKAAWRELLRHGQTVREQVANTCGNLAEVGICSRKNIQKTIAVPTIEAIEKVLSSPAYYQSLMKNALNMSQKIISGIETKQGYSRFFRTLIINSQEKDSLLNQFRNQIEIIYAWSLAQILKTFLYEQSTLPEMSD
jgi:hypothetical protein